MPKGPKGQKRPADVVSNAVQVMRIATGEADDAASTAGKNAAAVELGRKGGKARTASLTKSQRRNIALLGAKARWHKKK